MKSRVAFLSLTSVLVFLLCPSAHAQATRTWVSGVGDDVNPCSRTAPCKTFAGAISKTAAGGEIDALDPGGYGAVTITKAITIDGGGTLASILAAGSNGIIINIASGALGGGVVILRNLSINGAGTGLEGIRFMSGTTLRVENVTVDRFTGRGLHFNPAANAHLFVSNSSFGHNSQGIVVAPTGGTSRATVEGSRFMNNVGSGFRTHGSTVSHVRNSVASGNATGFQAVGSPGNAFLALQGCGASNNATNGISAGFSGGLSPTAFVSITNCLVTGNGTGLFVDASGIIGSWGDNKVVDNVTDGNPNSSLTLK